MKVFWEPSSISMERDRKHSTEADLDADLIKRFHLALAEMEEVWMQIQNRTVRD